MKVTRLKPNSSFWPISGIMKYLHGLAVGIYKLVDLKSQNNSSQVKKDSWNHRLIFFFGTCTWTLLRKKWAQMKRMSFNGFALVGLQIQQGSMFAKMGLAWAGQEENLEKVWVFPKSERKGIYRIHPESQRLLFFTQELNWLRFSCGTQTALEKIAAN